MSATPSPPAAATTPAQPDLKSVRCPRCGQRFDCARHAQPFDCWCKALPALPANELDPLGRCLCPECLASSVAGTQPVGTKAPG